jgi:nucleoside-diphosphate kinase
MDDERTLVLVKPDAVERNLVGPIIKHFEKTGIYVRAIKMMKLDRPTAYAFYVEHKGKPFYEELIDYMTSGPIVAMIIEGRNSVRRVRELIGNTNPKEAEIGTIRKMYATSKQKNAVHASDSLIHAAQEMEYIFQVSEHAVGTEVA